MENNRSDQAVVVFRSPAPERALRERVAGVPAALGRWFAGVRIRHLFSIPLWLAAVAAFVASDMLVYYVPERAIMGALRAAKLLDLAGVFALVFTARLGSSTARQLQGMQLGRRPVLYLRSFSADRNPITTWSDQELLSSIFRTLGPFIGIAEPGEILPEVGAAKMAADDDEWQAVVSRQIREAQVVVLSAGSSRGLRWETQRVLQLADPRHVIVTFSLFDDEEERSATYREFAEAVGSRLGAPLPPPEAHPGARFIRFDAQWRPTVFGTIEKPSTRWRAPVGCLSLGMALAPMRPFIGARHRRRLSRELGPFFNQIGGQLSARRVFGRLSSAVAVFFGGPLALCAILALNLRAVGFHRGALVAGLLMLMAALPPAQELGSVGMLLAIATYFAWPLLTPREVRQQEAFGGRLHSGWTVAALAILIEIGASMFLPAGMPLPVTERDRAMLVEVDELTDLLGPVPGVASLDPDKAVVRKTGHLDGSFSLEYRYQGHGLDYYCGYSRTTATIDAWFIQRLNALPDDLRLAPDNVWMVRETRSVTFVAMSVDGSVSNSSQVNPILEAMQSAPKPVGLWGF